MSYFVTSFLNFTISHCNVHVQEAFASFPVSLTVQEQMQADRQAKVHTCTYIIILQT